MRRRLFRIATLVIVVAFGVAAGAVVWVRGRLDASLPALDGTQAVRGLSSGVTVTRDSLGVPRVKGTSRDDVALATGFIHAQDRFFQMDLARRRAAGELAALVGGRALPVDVAIRLHRFRAVARQAIAMMPPRDRGVLRAYTDGVNAGLAALGAPPFEYLVLRRTPAPWLPEDCLLVILSMFITLQDADGSYEATLATMHDVLPPEVMAFMVPRGSEWDAPVVGGAFAAPPIPGPDVYNLRDRRRGKPTFELPPRPEDAAVGSNNWVVAGQLTHDGRPIVANDMHLTVRVPVTWYRATLEWEDEEGPHEISGVTLPGLPPVVVGSNTDVAWGFTNTYADWSDIVLLDIDPENAARYRTPDGWREFETHEEVIEVAGDEDVRAIVVWTIWGPVMGSDYRGRARAYRWVAHSPERLAMPFLQLERARTVSEAFDAANAMGVPGQNMVAADARGEIGWSIFGSIPRRRGLDGQLPRSWADGSVGWDGFLDVSEYPRLMNPPGGRIWTANARVVDGAMLAALGDGSYEIGSRATIIRDRLGRQDRFAREDMLSIQLDTSARFLDRWRGLLLETLTPGMIGGNRERARLRDVVETGWTGQASPDSAGYRLTRDFRQQVSERVIAFVLAECYEADPAFDHTSLRRREAPVWALVTGRPLHLLDPRFASWDDLLADAIDEVLERAGGDLADRVWSEYNSTLYRHPLSASLPIVGRWLDMPYQPVPGDLYTPRMHWGAAAASQRMVVSPGLEAGAVMQMPTGQSGHPLSPFYGATHDAWVSGQPTPLLPGPTAHTLRLVPDSSMTDSLSRAVFTR